MQIAHLCMTDSSVCFIGLLHCCNEVFPSSQSYSLLSICRWHQPLASRPTAVFCLSIAADLTDRTVNLATDCLLPPVLYLLGAQFPADARLFLIAESPELI